jgi:hypothetical protein
MRRTNVGLGSAGAVSIGECQYQRRPTFNLDLKADGSESLSPRANQQNHPPRETVLNSIVLRRSIPRKRPSIPEKGATPDWGIITDSALHSDLAQPDYRQASLILRANGQRNVSCGRGAPPRLENSNLISGPAAG